jgi:DNA-binding NtrC family response regulator
MISEAGKTVVLIVEDEPFILMNVADCVSDAGLEPVEATNADEALRELERRDDIDVVFTDVNMPGSLDGMQLSRVIAERWPDIRVIVTSGMVRPTRAELTPDVLFFPKPYDLDRVVESIRSLAA